MRVHFGQQKGAAMRCDRPKPASLLDSRVLCERRRDEQGTPAPEIRPVLRIEITDADIARYEQWRKEEERKAPVEEPKRGVCIIAI